MKLNVGITGQSGFIGMHLFNYLTLKSDEINLIEFKNCYFNKKVKLNSFVNCCDVIVHLAAMNRSVNSDEIYSTNIKLVQQLIQALDETNCSPFILFASSTQEIQENPYGRSKKEGRVLFEKWARKKHAKYVGLIIPNVFGPFCLPFYNSVIATFSHQLVNNLEPEIKVDVCIKLIYINKLVELIYRLIKNSNPERIHEVNYQKECHVSELLKKLYNYKKLYIDNNVFPRLEDEFDVALFNTFRSYIDIKRYPILLKKHEDQRGYLIETVTDKIGGQSFFSVTKPRYTRGNHFHRRKIERFCVVQGKGIIRMRQVGSKKVHKFFVKGDQPAIVDIPILYTHNISNMGEDNLITLFWSNEIFNLEDSDTYHEDV